MPRLDSNPPLLTRRNILRMLAVAGTGAVAWKVVRFGRGAPGVVRRSRVMMGTGVELTVLCDEREAAEAAAEATLERMAELEALLTRYRPDSELSRLNATGAIASASDALLDVLRLAETVSNLGDGAFDVTVQPLLDVWRERVDSLGASPGADAVERAMTLVDHRALRIEGRRVTLGRSGMRVTLDGIGKGYIVDAGVATLKKRGFPNVFVDAGGDLVAAGDKGSGRPWRVGIRNPRPGLAMSARFDARNVAVATSGDYMQSFTPDHAHHHIVDPRTGRSAPELASATVTAADAATADALATLAMNLGSQRARELLEELPDCEGYLVSKGLAVTRTSGFEVV